MSQQTAGYKIRQEEEIDPDEYYKSHCVQEWCDFPVEYEDEPSTKGITLQNTRG